jgi:hypothetical protein
VFLAESVKERRRGIGFAAADHAYFEQQFRLRVDRRV